MRTEPFSFTRNGQVLWGLIDYPAGGAPVAGIVLMPGHGGTHVAGGKQFLALRERFTAAGLACCVWDRPGCGESEGTFDINQTVQDSGEEAVVAVDAFAKQAGLALPRIGLWGISRGTGISGAVLAQRPTLGFWIAVSPPGDHDNLPYQLETNLRLEGRTEAQVRALMAEWRTGRHVLRTGGTYSEYLAAVSTLQADPYVKFLAGLGYETCSEVYFLQEQAHYRAGDYTVDAKTEVNVWPAFEALAKVRCPVIVLFGEKDTVLDWRDSARLHREAFAAGGNPDTTVRTFPGGNHRLVRCETGSVRELLAGGQEGFCEGYPQEMLAWLRQRGFGGSKASNEPAGSMREPAPRAR